MPENTGILPTFAGLFGGMPNLCAFFGIGTDFIIF